MAKQQLTPQQRKRAFQERLAELEERIPQLTVESGSGEPSAMAALRMALEERAHIQDILASGGTLKGPHDPDVVEPGDTVTLKNESDGGAERYTLVSEVEAKLDESWISVKSPVAQALVGRRKGETVEASTPGGSIRFKIQKIERQR